MLQHKNSHKEFRKTYAKRNLRYIFFFQYTECCVFLSLTVVFYFLRLLLTTRQTYYRPGEGRRQSFILFNNVLKRKFDFGFILRILGPGKCGELAESLASLLQ